MTDQLWVIVERVGEAIRHLDETGGNLTYKNNHHNLIHYVPTYVLKRNVNPLSLENCWNLLSAKQQTVLELYKPCWEHHNTTGRTQIDGPPPSKRNCYTCSHNC